LSERGEAAIRALLRDPSLGLILKIERARRIVGYAALCFGFSIEWGGRDAFLDDLYVEPAARRRGLGRRAIEHMIAAAAAAGCRVLHLEVMPGNSAQALYRRVGFAGRRSTILTRRLEPGLDG